ncbi:MAG: hypothetical protein D3906_17085 [Candidatus Electrothrix sp. AUS1_2]|nr:hypothetical protein [Candidatus Electrothrix sp. AUS1_2]
MALLTTFSFYLFILFFSYITLAETTSSSIYLSGINGIIFILIFIYSSMALYHIIKYINFKKLPLDEQERIRKKEKIKEELRRKKERERKLSYINSTTYSKPKYNKDRDFYCEDISGRARDRDGNGNRR